MTTRWRRSWASRRDPIEGPTHYSHFVPLPEAIWGERFLREGCLSVHYRDMVMEGQEVRAFIEREPGEDHAKTRATKRDGTEVLKGTASVGPRSRANGAGPAAGRNCNRWNSRRTPCTP